MKQVLIYCLLMIPSLSRGETSNLPADLIGKWRAIGYNYQGQFIAPVDTKMVLTFEFLADGTDILKWHRESENWFCERRGRWRVVDGLLVDEVVWVNPGNGFDCSQDPDMQMGKITYSRFWRAGTQLFIEIPFSEEVLVYVWNLQE